MRSTTSLPAPTRLTPSRTWASFADGYNTENDIDFSDPEDRFYAGSPNCLRRLLSNMLAGAKRRAKLTCLAAFPAA
jgi:hypothetical protein